MFYLGVLISIIFFDMYCVMAKTYLEWNLLAFPYILATLYFVIATVTFPFVKVFFLKGIIYLPEDYILLFIFLLQLH